MPFAQLVGRRLGNGVAVQQLAIRRGRAPAASQAAGALLGGEQQARAVLEEGALGLGPESGSAGPAGAVRPCSGARGQATGIARTKVEARRVSDLEFQRRCARLQADARGGGIRLAGSGAERLLCQATPWPRPRRNTPIRSWEAGDTVQGFALLTKKELRQDRNGKSFMDMELADASGSMSAKVWADSPAMAGQFEPAPVHRLPRLGQELPRPAPALRRRLPRGHRGGPPPTASTSRC